MSIRRAHTTLISAGELADWLAESPRGAERPVLLDCSFELTDPAAGRQMYLKEHLPGACYLHLDEALSGPATGSNGRHPLPDVAVFARRLAACGLHKTSGNRRQQVIVYDDQFGTFAARAWWMLRSMGHDAVALLNGGLHAWRAVGGPLESGLPPAPPPGDFEAPRGFTGTVDVHQVMRNLETGNFLVVDARAPERFSGEQALMDARPGHIPGASNRYFRDNLTPAGEFKSPAVLRDEFLAVLGPREPGAVVLQCGSGVTACHNALAMEIAGLHGAALYPGSFSEWSSDATRPVVKS